MPLRDAQRGVRIARAGRDRRRGRQGEQQREVPGRLGQLHLEGLVVRRRQAADRLGLAAREVVETLDDAVVEGIGGRGCRRGLPGQRADEVAGRDRHVLEGRCVMDVGLDLERPGEPVGRGGRQGGGQVRDQLVALLVGPLEVERHEQPGQATLQVLPPDRVVLALRIRALVEV